MATTIEAWGSTATYTGDGWVSSDPVLEDTLNAMTELDEFRPWTSAPNFEGALAKNLAKELKGKVVSVEPVDFVEGRVY